MKILLLEETDSTNTYVSVHADSLEDMTLVAAHSQTAGRGQRGNSWESEPGRNICATLFHRPSGVPARVQFAVSEATALGVADMLAHYGIEALVKWPNDVYVGDRKICGILIENAVAGTDLLHCRIGIGVNVNQTVFRSDAPNPVSMAMLLGMETPLSDALARLGEALRLRLGKAASPQGRAALHEEFLSRLWRGDGKPYPFRRRADGLRVRGVIDTVAPDGFITVTDSDSGEAGTYAFKEVEFLLEK